MSGGIANVVAAKAAQAHKTARFRIIVVLSCVETYRFIRGYQRQDAIATELQSLLLILLSSPFLLSFASYAEAGFAGPLFANVSASICRVAAFEPGARFSRHAS